MLTPSFDISQDKEFIIVRIRVPYVKISEAEFYINECEFKFHCKPYFLRLHLPGKLVEDGREKAVFDVDGGAINVHLPKLNPEEHFKDLDMLTTLLSKKPARISKDRVGAKPLIQVEGDVNSESSGSEDDFDWQIDQTLPRDKGTETYPVSCRYGFASQHRGVFEKLQEEIPSIIDCPDPEHTPPHQRRASRIAHEEMGFDPDHYLADLMDSDIIDGLLSFKPSWKEEVLEWTKRKEANHVTRSCEARSKYTDSEPGQDIVSFTQTEKEQLKDLPNKEYLIDKATKRCLYLGLIDIVYAFAYNHRTTEGEGNVESAWTICKLSSTLSWLEVHRGSVHEVVHSCLRRSLCYPLYRHWQLALTVLQDTRDIFRLGRRKLLQCFLWIRHCLDTSEPYFILNNLYITDYCVWLQKASSKHIQMLADDLDEVNITKNSLGWELEELEEAAQMVLQESSAEDYTEDCTETTETESSDSSSDVPTSDDEDEPRSKLQQTVCESEQMDNGKERLTSLLSSTDACSNDEARDEVTAEVKVPQISNTLNYISPTNDDNKTGVLERLMNLDLNDSHFSKDQNEC